MVDKLRWRIYYGDGSTYSGDPYWAPTSNVQAIAVGDTAATRGYRIVTSKDACIYAEEAWWGCDDAGMWDYLLNHKGPKAVIFGRTISPDTYFKILQRATREGLG